MAKDPYKKMIKADPYLRLAKRQFRDLDGAIAQANSDLVAYQGAGDRASARQALQTLADLSAQRQNLAALQQQYLQSRQPPPEPSAEERAARPLEKMDWQDGLELAKTSKYGANISANDPFVREGFAEVARRRARGE